MLYNPTTIKPAALVERIKDVTDDTFAKFYMRRAKGSYEEAVAQNKHGHIYWFCNGRLMQGHLTPVWAWTPLTEDGYDEPGINWGTKYFLTKEAARLFQTERLKAGFYQTDAPKYHEEGDVWSVHYHYEQSNW